MYLNTAYVYHINFSQGDKLYTVLKIIQQVQAVCSEIYI